jgi:hypothetical protein|tara:strand:- start:335 stop:616 length:282 start_codon:yes stop_codon:yes gene_type:complete
MPYPGIWLTAYRSMGDVVCGVFFTGAKSEARAVLERLNEEREEILAELPEGSDTRRSSGELGFASNNECREWLACQLNHFVNAFRPQLKAMAK